ncbi:hypothetical protein CWB76_18545 [Pseudoalteromonas sp. S1609]|uniref:hypothetical protein n=1 Tax=Pseudoalteromonas sp. S1609 TaxID=579505 RepID=UPI00110A763B|nr:hypothetical protein [Pseudoalteromonas sp. S1609]TMP66224.1 hypothetical protein CWB76_18545 [Pseudoalteromonas sp. S1609]
MIKTKLTIWIKKWLCNNVVYYSDKPYNLVLNAQQQFTLQLTEGEQKNTPLLQIVGRKHYIEHSEQYPVTNKKELASIIKMNNQSADNELHSHNAYIINSQGSDQSKVTYWRFLPLPAAWLNLPETLLLSNTLTADQVISARAFAAMYVTKHQQSVYSALASPLINSPERFASMFGVPCKRIINIEEPTHYAQALIAGLKQQSIKQLVTFFTPPTSVINKALIKKTSLIVVALCALYGGLTSAYLGYKTHKVQTQLAQNKSSVNQALNTLEQFEATNEQLNVLQGFTQNQRLASSLFFVLQQLVTSAELTNIRFEDNRYIIRGTANKATDALQIIINNPRTNNAKFDYPSRKERRGESFVISFTLNTLQDQSIPQMPNTKSEAK